jgi:hypothetical protein
MKFLFTVIVLFVTASLSAQEYLEKIANETCSCSKSVPDSLETRRLYLELGSCMLKAAGPYKKQLKKDHAIDLDDIENGPMNLGKVVGLKMATICPDMLMKFGNKKKEGEKTPEYESFQGRVTKIEKDFFVIFSINDNAGKSLKFYWLTNTESNIELVNKYEQLFDKDVKVKYHVMNLFDPKINDYRNFNVIDKIEQLSR